MNKVEIYTSQTCPYCVKAKRLLKMLGLEYTEHDVSGTFEIMVNDMQKRFGKSVSTIPQIIINDNYIGGYDDLESMHKSGKLSEVII